MELALGIIGVSSAVDLCFRYGDSLLRKIKEFRDADALISESITKVEYYWTKTIWQLRIINRVWQSLGEGHQDLSKQILHILVVKLNKAVLNIGQVEKPSSNAKQCKILSARRKGKYVLLVKECLDETLREIKAWQKMFDPSWYLMIRVSGSAIDEEFANANKNLPTLDDSKSNSLSTIRGLRHSPPEGSPEKKQIFLPRNGLAATRRHNIPLSTSQLLEMPDRNFLVIQPAECDDVNSDVSTLTKDVRILAGKLMGVDPASFSLLKCAGVVKPSAPKPGRAQSFDFIFYFPKEMRDPQSLRRVLLSSGEGHSLSARVRIAKHLASSICYVHALGFVHKNIRPETLLVFKDGKSSLGSLFLVGFTIFRMADGHSMRLGDPAPDKNLYRHPSRQGLQPEATYVMQHDIYSLGVCLLEIGLWKSFVLYNEEDGQLPQPTRVEPFITNGSSTKRTLVALARDELPKKMGDVYSRVVVNCLTCLDKDNADFGDESEFQDEDGVLVAVKYIEKVITSPRPSYIAYRLGFLR
ncbi:uncharacterized protein GIQ15_06583 [Arthroderma uncinatum]|uniref:uncharacterized protein n=1 Tax=Arthroderma uncinatum TaxID=74035 RepID=UPI00144AAFE0|nr:uncharacterized protein GIQ15_06583 [Arthroderma uncinatum]KAF3479607.1 hypothetical protein GIQ15_06583 [Arthroderma uncinatum]